MSFSASIAVLILLVFYLLLGNAKVAVPLMTLTLYGDEIIFDVSVATKKLAAMSCVSIARKTNYSLVRDSNYPSIFFSSRYIDFCMRLKQPGAWV